MAVPPVKGLRTYFFMQIGEAKVLGVAAGPDGSSECELRVVCPDQGFERLNVVAGGARVAVALDRPERGAPQEFKATIAAQLGETVLVEFYHPGEQAGARCSGGPPNAGR